VRTLKKLRFSKIFSFPAQKYALTLRHWERRKYKTFPIFSKKQFVPPQAALY